MLKRIILENFKYFEKQDFNLSDLTLVTGINGMGKSSLIQSLLLLKQSYVNTYLQTQNKVSLSNKSFVDLETANEFCNVKAFPKKVVISLETKDQIHQWAIDASKAGAVELETQYFGPGNYFEEALFSEDFIYLNAERLGPRKSYSINSNDRIFNTKIGIQGELTPAYIQKASISNEQLGIPDLAHPSLKQTEANKNPEFVTSTELYANINAWMGDILGREVIAKVSNIDKENLKLTFNIKGTKTGDVSAMQVGFGFSFCLPVILAALIAKPGQMLIVENPEAHLHPMAQLKIGKLLASVANHGVQVLIETHSDHVLNGVRLSVKDKIIPAEKTKILFFSSIADSEDKNYSLVEPKIDTDGRIDNWPKDFFDTWEYSMMDLM